MYTCPMHPEIQKNNAGICPQCGMNLIPEEQKEDKSRPAKGGSRIYDFGRAKSGHAGHSLTIFAQKFWISLILTIPVLLYSELPEKFFGFKAPTFPGSFYLPLVLGSIVFFYGGWVFLTSSYRELKARLPGMMTLIALAISVAYFYSLFAIFAAKSTLFWELTTLITVMLLGHWMEMRAVQGAQGALKELSKLLPDEAEIIRNNQTVTVPIEQLKVGDIILVRPGGKIPADGKITEGKSEVNESMISGESKPVKKVVGSEVVAGTINGDGSLKIEVTKIGEHTFLAGVMRLVAEAQVSKSKLQLLSDKAAYYLTLIAIGGGIITFWVWVFINKDMIFAMERFVAVLVIACPHALGLAIPLVATISTTMAAKSGFLIRNRLALELARKIDIVLFDKTGTLTQGKYGVSKIWPIGISDEKEVLKITASADAHSEHFVAKAIVEEAKKKKIEFLPVENFKALPGKGVRGEISGQEILVGGQGILSKPDEISQSLQDEIEQESRSGKTIIYVLQDRKLVGVLALADLVRQESRQAILELQKMGVKVAMITGDSEEVAKWVASELKINEYFARVLPQDKSAKVKMLQKEGYKVAAVGDGINDAPMLTQADLGIAIGAGTNVAIESAGIILVKNDPRDIVKIIKLSKATFSKMLQNLFWATSYNIIALPLAAGVLASKGILLQPALSALFMSLSTVIVAINALFLKQYKM